MSKIDNESTEQRRKALKKLLAGTGAAGAVASMPEKWTAPLVNSVTLPAHAQTSLPLSYTRMNVVMTPGALELLIPTAHAGGPALEGGMICVNFNADMTTFTARATIEEPAIAEAIGSGTVGTPVELEYVCGDQRSMWLTVESGPSQDGIPYTLCDGEDPEGQNTVCTSGTLPAGDCSSESGDCPGL